MVSANAGAVDDPPAGEAEWWQVKAYAAGQRAAQRPQNDAAGADPLAAAARFFQSSAAFAGLATAPGAKRAAVLSLQQVFSFCMVIINFNTKSEKSGSGQEAIEPLSHTH